MAKGRNLQRIKFSILDERRQQPDVILAHGIFHWGFDLARAVLFTLPSCPHFRGHDLKLRHRSFHLAHRESVFSTSMTPFKKRLHTCSEPIFGVVDPR